MSQLVNTYSQLPISFSHGDGCYLFDTDGKKYLDMFCGIAVSGLGHNHPKVTDAIVKQVKKVIHVSNMVTIPETQKLASKLASVANMPVKSFFCNSGAEASETMIKLGRLHGHKNGIECPKIVVFEKGFHGRTIGAVSASANPKIKEGFAPLLEGFVRVDYNNVDALNALSSQEDIAAVFLEPIQGEGGIYVPDTDYLNKVREICNKNNWLMLADEVQTGIGRTGMMFAFMHNNIEVDAFSLAKGLANGYPIGAVCIHQKYADYFTPGSHGTTFGGNPVASVAALATLNTIVDENLMKNAKEMGDYLLSGLKDKLKDFKEIKEIRGKGLMLAIEFDRPTRPALMHIIKHGVICNTAGTHCIRMLPPLIITKEQCDIAIETLPKAIAEFLAK